MKFVYLLIKCLFGIDIIMLMSDNDTLQTKNSSQAKVIDNLIEQLSVSNEELKETQRVLDIKQEELDSLEQEKNNLLKEKDSLNFRLNKITSKLDQLNLEYAELEGDFKKTVDANKQLLLAKENDINRLQLELEQKSKIQNDSHETDIPQNEFASLKDKDLQNQELISSLKQTLSQLQSEAINFKSKDVTIENLHKIISEKNEVVNSLHSKINLLQKENNQPRSIETKTTSSPFQMVEGVVIHKGPNVGERVNILQEDDENKFEYIGVFAFNCYKLNQQDSDSFPDVFYPRLNTPILKWQVSKSSVTTGVTEPLLTEALELLKDYAPDIEILQNISLSIRNRDYSYRPDIGLFWEKYNLCIDVEIDEPYDLVSRTPLHYIGSADFLRNLYFVSQGWVVVRFSEEQVLSQRIECVKYIAFVFQSIIADNVFNELLKDFECESSERWTYEKAMEYANDNYRETYLKIEPGQIKNDFQFSPFDGIPPADDILPEIDYSELEKKLSEIQKKYLRITMLPYNNQLVLEEFKCEKQQYKLGISGFELVEEKSTFIPFEIVVELEGLDTPFKYPLVSNSDNSNTEKIRDLVTESIYGCNPIRFEYCDAQSNITFRNIYLHSFELDSHEYLCDYIWKNYYKHNGSMITAHCLLRDDQRHFYIHRMKAIQLFDVVQLGYGHCLSFLDALWYPLKNNDLQLCRHIYKLIPPVLLEQLVCMIPNASYFAHYLLLDGRKEEAIEIYRKFDGKRVSDDSSWRDVVLKEFAELSEIGDYKPKFDEAIRLLGWNSFEACFCS